MADLTFTVDTSGLSKAAVFFSNLKDRLPSNMAKAMTYAAYDAQKKLRRETPRFVDRPTPWTDRSTFVKPATPQSLAVRLGFKDEAVKGTPAAKYLDPMVAGRPRPLKSSERQLQAAGILRPGEYIIPTGVTPLRLNRYGNLPGSTYTQVLSRLRALGEQGYTANRSDSARSSAKRRQRDYFVGTPGGLPRGIYARVGKGQRGFHTVFYITKQPRYTQQFPVRNILQDEFGRRFPSIFERLAFKA